MGFYRERIVKKTTRNHYCTGCRKLIPQGSQAKYQTGTVDGDFYSGYLCEPCDKFLRSPKGEMFSGGYYEGDVGETRQEHGEEV